MPPRDEEKTVVLSDKEFERLVARENLLFENLKAKKSKYVTSRQLAEALSISIHTVHKWRCQKKIEPRKFGRSVRYVVDEVVAALTQKGIRCREKQKR